MSDSKMQEDRRSPCARMATNLAGRNDRQGQPKRTERSDAFPELCFKIQASVKKCGLEAHVNRKDKRRLVLYLAISQCLIMVSSSSNGRYDVMERFETLQLVPWSSV